MARYVKVYPTSDDIGKTPIVVEDMEGINGVGIEFQSKAIFNQVNVKDYGAVGDGVTDDYTAIQSVIDNAVEGSTIIIGNHYLSTGLTITKSLHIAGYEFRNGNYSSGSITSGLKFANVEKGIDTTANLKLSNLVVRGVGYATSIGTAVYATNKSVILDNVVIQSFNKGVYVDSAFYVKMSNSYIGYCNYDLDFHYCYNVNLVNMSLSAILTNITQSQYSVVTMHGGSIEQYTVAGVSLTEHSKINLFGVYFEGNAPTAAFGIILNDYCEVVAIGNHVYLTQNIYWMKSYSASTTTGIKIFSRANRIVYPTSGTFRVYVFKINDALSYIDIAGDNWDTSAGASVTYVDSSINNQLAQNGIYKIEFPCNHPKYALSVNTANDVQQRTQVTPTVNDGTILNFQNAGYGTDDPIGIHTSAWGYHSYKAVYQNSQWEKVGIRLPDQTNSTATDVATLVHDFNSLLAKLRANGVMK